MAAERREDRVMISRLGAHTKWSQTADRTAATAPALSARLARYAAQVDPDGTLTDAERERRATSAMRADMQRLALRSAQVRRSRRSGRVA
jgi:hypothetical protein